MRAKIMTGRWPSEELADKLPQAVSIKHTARQKSANDNNNDTSKSEELCPPSRDHEQVEKKTELKEEAQTEEKEQESTQEN